MPRRCSLAAILFLFVASPASAQSGGWSADRPDAVAPPGVFADRTLPAGVFEASLRYVRTPQEGMRFGTTEIDPLSLFDTFEIVPFSLTSEGYHVRAAMGLSDRLTLAGRVAFVTRRREQITSDLTYFVLESRGLSDVEVHALWEAHASGSLRAHLHTGLTAPLGSVSASDGVTPFRADGTLPYDMQLGSGAWGITPGITAQLMNEHGLVGGQALATVYLLEKGDWRQGNRVEASAWAARRLNPYFSASARVHVESFEAIEGFDPELIPSRDPGEWPISSGGTRVSLPVGINLYMPEGRWQGHRLSLEFHFPVHERYDGPWLSSRRTATIGWQLTF